MPSTTSLEIPDIGPAEVLRGEEWYGHTLAVGERGLWFRSDSSPCRSSWGSHCE